MPRSYALRFATDQKYLNLSDSINISPYMREKGSGFVNKLPNDLSPGIFEFMDSENRLRVEIMHRGVVNAKTPIVMVYGWTNATAHETLAIAADLKNAITIYVMCGSSPIRMAKAL